MNSEKKKKAQKIRKILKERLNIDCLRMLTANDLAEEGSPELINYTPLPKLEITSQIISNDWVMMREINETE